MPAWADQPTMPPQPAGDAVGLPKMPATPAELSRRFFELADVALTYAKPIVHFGFIPAVILVGMLATKPQPTISQLLWLG